jgi:hypothetical protein
MPFVPWRRGACVLSAFVLVAALQAWPLPLSLSTRLTGQPTGDAGVYVWNLWVFRHQLVAERALPTRTMAILPLDGPTDLSLHNYTVFSDLLALPLLSWLDVVTTFNVVYLFNVALAGFGLYLLARRLTGRTWESFIAGAVFACSPFLVARSAAHFSLVAAAPLPFFLLFLLRAWDTRRLGDAAAVGVSVAWAAYCDPYYAVYCVMLGLAVALGRMSSLQAERLAASGRRTARRAIDVSIALLIAVIVLVGVVGGGQIEVGPLRVSMRSLYTPMLLLTVLILVRAAVSVRFRWARRPLPPARWMAGAGLAAVGVAAALLSPQLLALAERQAEGRMVSAPILWRSSPPGVDLVSLLAPNPHHPLAPDRLRQWMAARPNGLVDQVASLSWVGVVIVVLAWRRAALRLPPLWLAMTLGFALLSLGPFIQIAGLNTHVPTPWAVLRYVPMIGAARMPSRMAIVATLGFSVLVAMALAALTTRFAARRRLVIAGAAAALAVELLPIPRTLFSAEIPTIYDTVRADRRPVRVLELPTGVRDGLSSLGNFNASAQFHQAYHEKGIVGGYLSRVSQQTRQFHLDLPVFGTLMALSARDTVSAQELDAARAGAPAFLERANVGYVVLHSERISPELRAFAVEAFGLRHVGTDRGRELYLPSGKH